MQFDFGVIDPNTKNGAQLASDLNQFRDALHSGHMGVLRPAYARPGMQWVREISPERWELYLYTGAADILQGTVDVTGGAVAWASGIQTIASAATTDIGSVPACTVVITGTEGINSLGAAPAGTIRIVQFTAPLILSHNAFLILPGARSITTSAGDVGIFVSDGGGAWRSVSYTPAIGAVPISGAQFGQARTETTATYTRTSTSYGQMSDTCQLTPKLATSTCEVDIVAVVEVTSTSGGGDDALARLRAYYYDGATYTAIGMEPEVGIALASGSSVTTAIWRGTVALRVTLTAAERRSDTGVWLLRLQGQVSASPYSLSVYRSVITMREIAP